MSILAGSSPSTHDKGSKQSFFDLPGEIRNIIYRFVFRRKKTLNSDLGSSLALLRTCKQVHIEGRGILYGGKCFIFGPRTVSVGAIQDLQQVLMGYWLPMHFFSRIGAANVGLLRHLSLILEDLSLEHTMDMTHDQRKFASDLNLRLVRIPKESARLKTLGFASKVGGSPM